MKKWSALLLTMAVLLVLSACSGGNGGSATQSPNGDSGSKGSGDAGKQVTLRVLHWINEPVNKYMEDVFIPQFEEKYTNVKIDYTTVPSDSTYDQLMQTRINANDADIVAYKSSFVGAPQEWSPGAADPLWKQWADAGLLADLTEEDFIANYNPVDVENAMTYDGKVYGVNMGKVSFTGLFYNKDIFAQYNLDVPTTWDEFMVVLNTLKDNGVTPIGFAGKEVWPINLAVQGLQATIHEDQLAYIKGLWTGETKFTDPAAIEVLEKAQIMMNYAQNGFMGTDYGTLPSLFAAGQVAMAADGTWNAATYQGLNPDLNFGYFPIPGSSNAAVNGKLAGKYDMTWMVVEKSSNKDWALTFLEEMSSRDNYTAFVNAAGFLPTQDVTVDSEFINEIMPYLGEFILAWDQLAINRENVGQYADGSSPHAEFLKPAGPLESPQELADLSQKDWDAAAQ
ncbi:extracellular solute-binding protein [Xylanibacillus composti]|uniref:Extracellular solute-binding protein n=1 Tax=Xylanibacillus composti TaxID=1572762 RepID=A0A8J4M2I6_9BACL|nr:extracellular solute-binding protein [Xylanibacillus composti]MDT9726544.1 extracellular solute-binding protein [Xylanibacillus composti]GIQ68962.1 hypothetical protein XYCOK13_17860 [Xylanibacillus composti]